MGICSSCLNQDLDRDFSDEDEQSRLLYDDSLANHGRYRHQNPRGNYADKQEVQQANKALMQVVSKTSDDLVDIFAMIPQEISPSTTATLFSIQDDHPQFYKNIMKKIRAKGSGEIPHQDSSNDNPPGFDGWDLHQAKPEKPVTQHPVISGGVGPFIGGFSDPASAIDL